MLGYIFSHLKERNHCNSYTLSFSVWDMDGSMDGWMNFMRVFFLGPWPQCFGFQTAGSHLRSLDATAQTCCTWWRSRRWSFLAGSHTQTSPPRWSKWVCNWKTHTIPLYDLLLFKILILILFDSLAISAGFQMSKVSHSVWTVCHIGFRTWQAVARWRVCVCPFVLRPSAEMCESVCGCVCDCWCLSAEWRSGKWNWWIEGASVAAYQLALELHKTEISN